MASEKGSAAEAPIYGVSAEFETPGALLDSVRRLRPQRLGRIETHAPVPIDGLSEALGTTSSLLPFAVGWTVVGFVAMMAMCIYATAFDYVFDVGGRPLVSWPAFMVPSVSFGVLLGALATGIGFLFANRLPHLNHPAYNIPGFTRATQDRFFITILPHDDDHRLDLRAIEAAFRGLAVPPATVVQVPR